MFLIIRVMCGSPSFYLRNCSVITSMGFEISPCHWSAIIKSTKACQIKSRKRGNIAKKIRKKKKNTLKRWTIEAPFNDQ